MHSIFGALKSGLRPVLIRISGENGALSFFETRVDLKSGRPKNGHGARKINGWSENGGPKWIGGC